MTLKENLLLQRIDLISLEKSLKEIDPTETFFNFSHTRLILQRDGCNKTQIENVLEFFRKQGAFTDRDLLDYGVLEDLINQQ